MAALTDAYSTTGELVQLPKDRTYQKDKESDYNAQRSIPPHLDHH